MSYRDKIYERYATLAGTSTGEFDFDAARHWQKAIAFHFRQFLPPDKDARILEVACGHGYFLLFLRDRGYDNVFGVDISPEQVAIAKTVSDQVQLGNAMEYLAKHERDFDMIVGLDIIEHLTKDEAFDFLELVHKALRPGGRVLFTTPNADNLFAAEPRYYDFTHEICFSPHSMSQLLGACGFEVIGFAEAGPAPLGVKSTIRYVLWKGVVRQLIKAYNMIEQGHGGSGIYTRNFIVCAQKVAAS